jgi:hypothetical protein
VKRKLRILSNLKPSASPNKTLPSIAEERQEHVYGKPRAGCDNINEVIQYSHLNDFLRQKLRENFNMSHNTTGISKNLHSAIAALNKSKDNS